jgi:type II secretory ATPase GspE/PulE/Tfp pilus assembly ATPase PilB-like protein
MSNPEAVEFQSAEWTDLEIEPSVAALLDMVAGMGASDLFFCTNEKDVDVTVRHLGIVRPLATLSLDRGRRSMTHVRVMAGMDVAERRHPLDGRWVRRCANGGILDLRINTIPTLYGEDMTLRLLVRDSQFRRLDGLGLLRQQYNSLVDLLNRPGGLLLVTGPTGSGKTTTLYACLHYLHDGSRKINTIEDPIEYSMPGVRQSQVNLKIDVDFPELLRGVLRQSPNVIMIGEVRDPITAETAVRAANSGHLVCATLHAPIAAGAIESMLSLGVHPHFLSTGLLGVVAQRLVRTLCPKCQVTLDLSEAPDTFADIKPWLTDGQGQSMSTATGCEQCGMSGFTARTGIFEVLTISRELRKQIALRRPGGEIERQALQDGMLDFRRCAMLKVAQGQTNIEEVLRVVPAEHLETDG